MKPCHVEDEVPDERVGGVGKGSMTEFWRSFRTKRMQRHVFIWSVYLNS